jgi:hypothetical protein
VTEAIFGLLGVIVGGVLQAMSSWVMERQRAQWATRKAGRLFAPKLGRCDFILTMAHERGTTWAIVGQELREALEAWPEHADAFAATLRPDDWNKLVQAIMEFERIEQVAGVVPHDERINDENREYLGWVGGIAFDAMLTSGLVGLHGSRPPRLRAILRRLRHPLRRRDVEAEAKEFMAWYTERVHGQQRPPVS